MAIKEKRKFKDEDECWEDNLSADLSKVKFKKPATEKAEEYYNTYGD